MTRATVIVLGCFLVAVPSGHAQVPKKEDLPKLIKQLTATDAKVRTEACEGIARIGEVKKIYAKEAYVPLADVLRKDSDMGVRAKAAETLGRIEVDPDPAVVSALVEALKTSNRPLQIASANTVAIVGPGASAAADRLKELKMQAEDERKVAQEEVKKAEEEKDQKKRQVARQRAQAAGTVVTAMDAALKSIERGGK